MFFMMGKFPSLQEAAGIFYTGARENRVLGRKSLKNAHKIAYGIPELSPFCPKYNVFFGFREIAFDRTTPTPTKGKWPFPP